MKNPSFFHSSNQIFFKFILLNIFLIGGCAKTTVIIDPCAGESETGTGTESDTLSNNLGTFHASAESLSLTNSMTPIQIGVQASMYAYNATTGNLAAQGNYQSMSLGTLSGTDNYQMYLPDDTCNFYGISTNTGQRAPAFNNNLSEPLSNGVDYLWWGATNEIVNASRFNIPIVFSHRAAQIVFEVSEGNGITIDSLLVITTLAPEEGARMDLLTGTILPAIDNQTGFVNSMIINDMIAQPILLPITNWNNMAFLLQAMVNGETQPRTFGGQVPIPEGQLQSGNSYWFKIIINANSVEIPSVGVTGWTIVDETGKPVYPGQMFL